MDPKTTVMATLIHLKQIEGKAWRKGFISGTLFAGFVLLAVLWYIKRSVGE